PGRRGPGDRVRLRALRLPAAGHRAGRPRRPAGLNPPKGGLAARRVGSQLPLAPTTAMRLPSGACEAALPVPIDRRSVTRELRLLLQGVDGLAGEGLAAALQKVAEAATLGLRAQGAGVLGGE